jgi:hypothetical protein
MTQQDPTDYLAARRRARGARTSARTTPTPGGKPHDFIRGLADFDAAQSWPTSTTPVIVVPRRSWPVSLTTVVLRRLRRRHHAAPRVR